MEIAHPGLSQLVSIVRRDAFGGLLRGDPVTVSQIAVRRQVPPDRVRAALDQLVLAGAAEVVGDGEIVGAHGLTTRTTRHSITLDGRVLHTWCALDAVGIPVALGLDATAATTCPTCGAPPAVSVRAGQATQLPFVLWLPTGPCPHLTRDFCSAANLFCDTAHAEAWKRQAGNPQGRVISLAGVEDNARVAWTDVAAEGSTVHDVEAGHDDTQP